MATKALKAPAPNIHAIPLDVRLVPADRLVRVSWHDTGEPYFGTSGGNRFDDPDPDVSRRFGTCYLGMSLVVAFAESVLHDRAPVRGRFHVPHAELESRFAVSFPGADLRLARLTGTALKTLGGNGELTGTSRYRIPQRWARAIASHPDNVDGFMYMSRHVNDAIAVVLFQRDPGRPLDLVMEQAVPLHQHTDFPHAIAELRVTAV